MKELKFANQQMSMMKKLTDNREKSQINEDVSVGVDLGTASIVFVVVNKVGKPIFCAFQEADVIKDGLIVKYSEAVQIVKQLKQLAEETLGIPILSASGAIPPGIEGNNFHAVGHVIESAEMELNQIVDEPVAAAKALKVDNGAVVDIGGGTTGISIFKNGNVVYSADEATGGTQMTLVLSGALKISIQDGEKLKRDPLKEKENFMLIKPVVEKMATITERFIKDYGQPVDKIYLVGGATNFREFAHVFEKKLNINILQPNYPEFVTPLGIALASLEGERI